MSTLFSKLLGGLPFEHVFYRNIPLGDLDKFRQGAQRRLKGKKYYSVFTAGIRYKAVYDGPSMKNNFFVLYHFVSSAAVPFALVFLFCCVGTDSRTVGRTVTSEPKPKLLTSKGYHIFLPIMPHMRAFGYN